MIEAFREHSPSLPISKRRDFALGALLGGIKEGEWPTDPLMKKPLELPHLLNAFNDVAKKKEGKKLEEGLGVYDETTCYEFHRLLVATIHTYTNALGALRMADREVNLSKEAGKTMRENFGHTSGDQSKKHNRELERSVNKFVVADVGDIGIKSALAGSLKEDLDSLIKAREECAEWVWKFSFLLWRIASSQILSHHLVILDRSSLLQMPSQAGRAPRAETLGLFTGLSSRRHENGTVPHHQGWVADEDNGRVRYEDEDGDTSEEDEGFDEEYCHIWEAFVGDKDFAIAFQSWICLQINDWTALQTISSWSLSVAKPYQGVKIHLLAMKEAGHARYEMEGWETILRNLAAEPPQLSNGLPVQSSFDAQSAINLLKQKIDKYASDPRRDSILKAFTPKSKTADQYNPVIYSIHHFGELLALLMASLKIATINSIEL